MVSYKLRIDNTLKFIQLKEKSLMILSGILSNTVARWVILVGIALVVITLVGLVLK